MPYMEEVILTNISIQGGLVDPDVDGFLSGPGEVMPLPAYYVEIFHIGKVASGGLVALYWQRCSKMFFLFLT